MEDKKNKFQFIWAILLVSAGIGLFFRIPQLMPRIKNIAQFEWFIYFIYFCFYLVGILLIVGGGRKIYDHLKQSNREKTTDDID